MRVRIVTLLALAAALAACSESAPSSAAASGEGLRLAVIPKGTTHVFWKSVERGARDAAAELDVDIVWKGPLQEDDRAQQIQLVQQFVADGVDGIALAPLDHTALAAVVASAKSKSIPVVIYDSALDGRPGHDFASFVATNNEAGGRMGGEELARLLGGQGKVVLLRYAVGSASTEERAKGFLEAAHDAGLEVTVANRYAGATAGAAKTAALNLIDDVKRAQGVFCTNESSTQGMLLALQQAGLAGSVRFVGFDASPPLVAALRDGSIDALVVQNPRKMGHLAVKTLAAAIRGETVEASIDTGAVLVTRENMGEPEIAVLLE